MCRWGAMCVGGGGLHMYNHSMLSNVNYSQLCLHDCVVLNSEMDFYRALGGLHGRDGGEEDLSGMGERSGF